MVIFDTSVVAIAFDANAAVPQDPDLGRPLLKARERIDYLIKTLADGREKVLLPTPVVAEYIVGGGPDKEKRLEILTRSRSFKIASFDLRAAIECALIEGSDAGKRLSATETKAKVKYDRQIIAIALAQGATMIYTGDIGLGARAKACGLNVTFTWELPLPPEHPQMHLNYEEKNQDAADA